MKGQHQAVTNRAHLEVQQASMRVPAPLLTCSGTLRTFLKLPMPASPTIK